MNANLIQRQEQAIAAILAAGTQGKRAASYGFTVLNKKARVLRGIRHQFEKAAKRFGYTEEQISAQWRDICDMAKLEAHAE